MTARTPTRASSPSSASSPTAGGTRRAISGRCTRSIRCASTGSTASRRCTASASSTSAAAAASSPMSMARRGADVLGIDLAAKPLKVAAAARHRGGDAAHRVPRGRGRVARRGDARRLRRRHLHGDARARARIPASVVAACGRLVKPGGWAFFSTINRNAKAFVFAIVGAEHVLKLLPRGTHEYAKFLRPSELAAWCRAAVARAGGDARPRIQPAVATLSALGRHQRQLPRRLPQAGMTAARSDDAAASARCCSTSTAP